MLMNFKGYLYGISNLLILLFFTMQTAGATGSRQLQGKMSLEAVADAQFDYRVEFVV